MSSEQGISEVPSSRRYRQLGRLSIVLLSILVAGPSRAAVETPASAVDRTPPRLSLIVGDVSFWRQGTDEWVAAQLNMALAPGDALYAGTGARAEVQIGGRAFVRLGDNTQLTMANQEPDFVQLKLTSGLAALDLRELERGHSVEVDMANAAVTVEEPGYYRFDVSADTTTVITRRGGRARVRLNGGQTSDVGPNDRLVIEGGDEPQLAVYNAPAVDDWDRWNYDRTDGLLASASSRYLPRDVYGAETLDEYGTWTVEPTYGRVWVPRDVSPGWAPYSAGQWAWDGYYGWTWVDAAPWGWAPFHYGRWVYLRNCWGWAPGPVVFRPVYSPALVAFFGGPGFRVGVGVPFVSWVALGWGEPLLPWWGGPGFVGVPCWHGWGGPRVVNNVFVTNTTIVNVHQPNAFANTRVRSAVITVPRDGFGTRPVDRLRTAAPNTPTLRPLGGELPRPVSLTRRPAPPPLPRGATTTAGTGRDAARAPSVGQSPNTGTAFADRHVAPPRTGASSEQRVSSFTDVPHATGQAPSFNQAARREPPPPPPRSGSEQRVPSGHDFGYGANSAPAARRQPAPPPVREAAREQPQGAFSPPVRPRQPDPPRVEERRQPAPVSAPPAPPVASAPAPSARSYGGGGQMVHPHSAPAPRVADAPQAGAPQAAAPPAAAAPMHAPGHSSGGSAPRGHAVHAR